MNKVQKVVLVSIAATLVLSILFALFNHNASFLGWYATICLIGSLLSLVSGIIFLTTNGDEIGKGLLLSAGIHFLIGFASCTASLNIH